MKHCVASLLALSIPVLAADVRGPALGLWHDTTSKVLRRIEGLPGAAQIGDAIRLPFVPENASPSPDGLQMLCVAGSGGRAWLVKLDGSAAPVADSIANITHIGWSTERTAAVYSQRESMLQTIRVALDGAMAEAPVPVPAAIGTVTAIVPDALATLGERGGSLWFLRNGEFKMVSTGGRISALAALQPDVVLLADQERGSIIRLDLTTGSAEDLAGPDQGIRSPIALAVRGRQVFVLSGEEPAGILFHLDEPRSTQLIKLPVVADRITSAECGTTLMLDRAGGSGTIWLFEWSRPERLLFVPAVLMNK